MKHTKKGQLYTILKYVIVLNTWVYLLRMIAKIYDEYVGRGLPVLYIDFYKWMLMTVVTILFAYAVLKIEAIRDKVVKSICTILLVLANVSCIGINLMEVGGYPSDNLRWTAIIFIIMAFICIALGFKKHYLLIRRFGLGLPIFSTGKLFIFDLYALNGIGRIVAYFCVGLVLIGISFIYQKLRTSMEGVKADEETL